MPNLQQQISAKANCMHIHYQNQQQFLIILYQSLLGFIFLYTIIQQLVGGPLTKYQIPNLKIPKIKLMMKYFEQHFLNICHLLIKLNAKIQLS
ncbi:unnamed protein product [Paramecium sonneborni]|uniref:Transmembrane protein n=1 Tax=Paramecium sonneborni TaxID=65129 RepID=A0A8S1LQG7_9CILI|nr:unnamed protein product [Paramecium sonneborni]